MQFVWIGFLKSGERIEPALQQKISDFLQQPFIPIGTAGVLRHQGGDRAGYLVIFEAADHATAEALVRSSPVREAGLYSEFHLFEFQYEVR
jgi:hypothetical protein